MTTGESLGSIEEMKLEFSMAVDGGDCTAAMIYRQCLLGAGVECETLAPYTELNQEAGDDYVIVAKDPYL